MFCHCEVLHRVSEGGWWRDEWLRGGVVNSHLEVPRTHRTPQMAIGHQPTAGAGKMGSEFP